MIISEDKNTRAERMWSIISRNVDFRRKRVIDLGCGTGDFVWRCLIAGAQQVMPIDIDTSKFSMDFLQSVPNEYTVNLNSSNINEWVKEDRQIHFDIAMCFSVLPYLDDIPATIQWMAITFDLSLIEAQYDPEPFNVGVVSDRGMAQLLLDNGFNDVEPIGKSYVDYRDVWRTIWRCE